MAPQSPTNLEFITELEAFANRFRRLSGLPENRAAASNEAIEAALKDISAQLQNNKKQIKELRQEVQSNKNQLLYQIVKWQERMADMNQKISSMEFNNIARMVNQHAKKATDKLMPLRSSNNYEIEDFPETAAGFFDLDAFQCHDIAEKLDWSFAGHLKLEDMPRDLLKAVGYGGDINK